MISELKNNVRTTEMQHTKHASNECSFVFFVYLRGVFCDMSHVEKDYSRQTYSGLIRRMFFDNADVLLQVLFSYDWLHAKLSAMSIHDVLHDFDEAIEAGVSDPELGLVASALRVGGPNIGCNANSLAFDLLGRLLAYYDYQVILPLLW